MDLYFLRHAKAVERSIRSKLPDHTRALTPEGEEKMRLVGRGIRRLELSFALILSSPYLRARRTAEILADILKEPDRLKLSANLAPDGDPKELVSELNSYRRRLDSVVLVGHEPYFSEMISRLISGDKNARLDMKKAGLCKLSATSLRWGQCATLEWLLTPRQLALLGKAG